MTDYPDALVERVAKALHEADIEAAPGPWSDASEPYRQIFHTEARAALDAAGYGEMLAAAKRVVERIKAGANEAEPRQPIDDPAAFYAWAGSVLLEAIAKAEGRE